MSRRHLLQGLAGALAWWTIGPAPANATTEVGEAEHGAVAGTGADPVVVPTLEAFADTVIPGARRWPGDRAVAGADDTPGAVGAGAIELLQMPEAGVAALLPELAALVNGEATGYAARHGRVIDPTVPPLVALSFEDRARLLRELLAPAAPDQRLWTLLALLVFAAYHTAGHRHTDEALAGGHPGMAAIGFPEPDADGLWRFEEHSYGRRLAELHPDTTPSGSPA